MTEQNKIQISLQEIEVKDLEGRIYEIEDLFVKVSNWLFTNTEMIEVDEAARILTKGGTVAVSEEALEEMALITKAFTWYKLFARKQISQYFTDKITELKNQTTVEHEKEQ